MLDKINGLVTTAASAAGNAAGLEQQVSEAAGRVRTQDSKASGFAERAGALDQKLQELEPKITRLVADAAAARSVLTSFATIGATADEVNRRRDAVDTAMKLVLAAQGRAEAEADAAMRARQRVEEQAKALPGPPIPNPTGPQTVSPDDRTIQLIGQRLDKLGATLKPNQPSPPVEQPVDLPAVAGNDCQRVQQALVDVGVLRPPPPVRGQSKPPSPVHGQCEKLTNAAARGWQIREHRSLAGAHNADAIERILREPAPAQTRP